MLQNYYGCATKLRLSSRSSGSPFPLLRLCYKVATFEPELRESVSLTTAVLESCDFRAGAPGVRFLYYGCTTKLRLSTRNPGNTFSLLQNCDLRAGALGVRFLYYGCTSCDFRAGAPEVCFFTTAALQSCDFRAGAPGVRFLCCTSCDFRAGELKPVLWGDPLRH